ncbi:hypothetical protein ABVN07_23425, partial [Salmonella sp. SJTUF15574]|uniref:hypothetical protein n=1 Tax=Salmonella sp. SJTUF15574 TaxID=3229550 RepID=UPI0037296A23
GALSVRHVAGVHALRCTHPTTKRDFVNLCRKGFGFALATLALDCKNLLAVRQRTYFLFGVFNPSSFSE